VILSVNGRQHVVSDAEGWESLLLILRERLGLYGSKNACEQGECGSCTVLLDGEAVCSCLVMGIQAQGRQVVTIEGLDDDPVAECLRDALAVRGAVQCGFCTPGFVVSATELIQRTDTESLEHEELLEGLSGNLCRCTGYSKILEAVKATADLVRNERCGRRAAEPKEQSALDEPQNRRDHG
jgi:carbon-monoxide dehydrogenase small subunit